MSWSVRSLRIGLLSGIALLLLAGSSEAQYRGLRGRVGRRAVVSNAHMPGWDWWRIYPWSPYNYGRNPYNPIVYPYVVPYPVYTPGSVYGAPPSDPGAVAGAGDSSQQPLLPHPSGAVAVPPANAAEIQIRLPDRFGEVWFDGVETSSIGTTRYYITPDLPGDKALRYVVTAKFRRDGQTVSEERKVKVGPGQVVVVDFTKPAPAQAGAEG